MLHHYDIVSRMHRKIEVNLLVLGSHRTKAVDKAIVQIEFALWKQVPMNVTASADKLSLRNVVNLYFISKKIREECGKFTPRQVAIIP